MFTRANKAIAKRFFDEVCNARRLDVANELFSADHKATDPAIAVVIALCSSSA